MEGNLVDQYWDATVAAAKAVGRMKKWLAENHESIDWGNFRGFVEGTQSFARGEVIKYFSPSPKTKLMPNTERLETLEIFEFDDSTFNFSAYFNGSLIQKISDDAIVSLYSYAVGTKIPDPV